MTSETELWDIWHRAADRPALAERLREMLDAIDQQVAGSGFACQQSGRCCRFESFGHRLYMTGLEIAWFRLLAGPPASATVPDSKGDATSIGLTVLDPKQDGCPYQVDGACSVHPDRPFACRVFFCQEGSDDWQSAQYEAFQSKMKKLHQQLGLPYRYMEWRQGLADAQSAGL